MTLRGVWEWLVEPPPTVVEADERRNARILAALLICVIVLGSAAQVVQLLCVPGYFPTFVAIAAAIGALAVAYLLVRRARIVAGARVLAGTLTLSSLASAAVGPTSQVSLAFVALGPLVATLLLRLGDAIVVGALAVVGATALVVAGGIPRDLSAGALSFLVIATTVALVGRLHRDRLEADRKATLLERERRLRQLLEEKQRADAQLRLADRLKSLGTLTAGVAHELNNPMTFVSLSLDLVETAVREGHAGDAQHALSDMRDGVGRMTKIVRGLKTFARTEEELVEDVDVTEVVESTLRMASSVLKKRTKIVRDLDPNAPRVRANAGKLAQVILNLVINAAQAIPDDEEGEIGVRVSRVERVVTLSVRDTGVGIAPDVREHIFDPFFTTKAVGEGTGLGLAICHGIVTSFGGSIRVESEVGAGSTFHVELPAA